MDNPRVTPHVTTLKENEIFVFGSNLCTAPKEVAGAAHAARFFGSNETHALGFCGSTYAIPTKDSWLRTLPIKQIHDFVQDFLDAAEALDGKRFLVTAIGCGLAGLTPWQVAPMFRRAVQMTNVALPVEFWRVLADSGVTVPVSSHILHPSPVI